MRRNRKYLKEKKVREEGSEAEAATDSTLRNAWPGSTQLQKTSAV
jgi:hypothetical protein